MSSTLRQLRHDVRGRANTLMLCMAALPLAGNQAEKLEFVDEIIKATETLVETLDELEALPEHFSSDGAGLANPPK